MNAIAFIVMCGCMCGLGITVVEQVFQYKKKRLKEQSRTNNLAIIYQLLSAREDLKLEDVTQMLELSDKELKH